MRWVTPEPQSTRKLVSPDWTRLAGPKRCGWTCGQPVPSSVTSMAAQPSSPGEPSSRFQRRSRWRLAPSSLKRGAAVRDLAVVDVLELAAREAELEPALGRLDDLAERGERCNTHLVEHRTLQRIALVHVVVVVARHQRAARSRTPGARSTPHRPGRARPGDPTRRARTAARAARASEHRARHARSRGWRSGCARPMPPAARRTGRRSVAAWRASRRRCGNAAPDWSPSGARRAPAPCRNRARRRAACRPTSARRPGRAAAPAARRSPGSQARRSARPARGRARRSRCRRSAGDGPRP